jgi:transposase
MEMRGGRRFRTKAERRQIVEETMKPGASVSQVARAHDVNANQVFHWRRQYREGWFDEKESKPTGLLPVRITRAVTRGPAGVASAKAARVATAGVIDIDLGHARIRIEGSADPSCVRAALEGLVR